MNKSLFSFSALTHKSIADVTRRRGRTILVVLGIMIGVLGLTTINVTSDAIQSAFTYSNNHTASPNISFSVQGVDPALTSTLEVVPNVQAVQIDTFYATRWRVAAPPGHVELDIIGYQDFQGIKLNPFQLSSGRLPGLGEIVLESSDRALQSVEVGDMVAIDTPSGPAQLRVVGLSRTLGQASATLTSTAAGYMRADALSRISGITAANDIEIKIFDKSKAEQTARALADILRTNHVTVLNSSIVPDPDLSNVNGLLTIMLVLSMIALLLTSFLIINTVTTLVAEQTKIIGTMKAIGGSRLLVVRSYLLSVGIYGVVGTALGLGLGIFGGYQLTLFIANLLTFDLGSFHVTPGIMLTSTAVGLGVPFAAALLPLWAGTRITVRDAIANYGVSNQNGVTSQNRFVRRLIWIPQSTWLGVHGLFRKRGRAALTLLALTLAGTAFLAIQATTYSFDQFLGQLFNVYKYDATVSITQPQPYDQLRTQIMAIPNVGRVERFEQQPVKIQGGQLFLTGVEPGTQEYHYQLVAGRWFSGNEPNALLISEDAVSKAHLKVGDALTLSSATNTVTWTIIGEVQDFSGVGGGVAGVGLTTVDNFNTFNGLPTNLALGFMVQAVDRSEVAVDQMANRLDDTLSHIGLSPTVTTAQEFKDRGQSQLRIVYLLLYVVAAVVALVGMLALFNTLTTSVLERRREIGILRSMGATGWRVASVFWLEGICLALIAWFVGILLGIPAAYGFVKLIQAVLVPLPFAFDPSTLGIMLIFIIVIATLASFGPVLSAARVRVVDTLRYE